MSDFKKLIEEAPLTIVLELERALNTPIEKEWLEGGAIVVFERSEENGVTFGFKDKVYRMPSYRFEEFHSKLYRMGLGEVVIG